MVPFSPDPRTTLTYGSAWPVRASNTLPWTSVICAELTTTHNATEAKASAKRGAGLCIFPFAVDTLRDENAELIQHEHGHGNQHLTGHVRWRDQGGQNENGDQRMPTVSF